jgi:hypothetical protein
MNESKTNESKTNETKSNERSVSLNPRRFKMGRSRGASFEFVTGNLVEESNGFPFEFFNGVNDISSYLTIYKKKTDILLIYYLDYIRNYSTLTNDMIQNIELFNDENKMKIINELVIANKSILDYVYEGCDNEKD